MLFTLPVTGYLMPRPPRPYETPPTETKPTPAKRRPVSDPRVGCCITSRQSAFYALAHPGHLLAPKLQPLDYVSAEGLRREFDDIYFLYIVGESDRR